MVSHKDKTVYFETIRLLHRVFHMSRVTPHDTVVLYCVTEKQREKICGMLKRQKSQRNNIHLRKNTCDTHDSRLNKPMSLKHYHVLQCGPSKNYYVIYANDGSKTRLHQFYEVYKNYFSSYDHMKYVMKYSREHGYLGFVIHHEEKKVYMLSYDCHKTHDQNLIHTYIHTYNTLRWVRAEQNLIYSLMSKFISNCTYENTRKTRSTKVSPCVTF